MKNRSAANSRTKNREIRITREFNAPPKLVFEAFTKPEKIGQWWGPNGFSTTTHEMNFDIGGDWKFTMHGPDGTDYPNHIVYTDIKQPELLKYDHYGHEDEDTPHFKTTIQFQKVDGGGTKLTMQMLFPTVEDRENAEEFGAVEGGKQTLGRLAEHLSNVS